MWFQNDKSKSYYEVKCQENQNYAEPSTWPECVDKLDCKTPDYDKNVFTSTWAAGDGLTPPFTVE